jgi:hypothetical protein
MTHGRAKVRDADFPSEWIAGPDAFIVTDPTNLPRRGLERSRFAAGGPAVVFGLSEQLQGQRISSAITAA